MKNKVPINMLNIGVKCHFEIRYRGFCISKVDLYAYAGANFGNSIMNMLNAFACIIHFSLFLSKIYKKVTDI